MKHCHETLAIPAPNLEGTVLRENIGHGVIGTLCIHSNGITAFTGAESAAHFFGLWNARPQAVL